MGLNWKQFELGILRLTLEGEPEVAVKLVGETIWHESDRLQALGQYPRPIGPNDSIGNPGITGSPFGPGLGIASIEEATWDWMVHRISWPKHWGQDYLALAWDLRLNVLACRFRYKLDKRALPEDTLSARADYWLNVYNGSGVAARRQKYVVDATNIQWVK